MSNFIPMIKLIPRAIPMIPARRLPIERTLANIAIVLFKYSLTNRIDNINTIDNGDRIQDIVTYARADITLACIFDAKTINSPHPEIVPSEPHTLHNPSVAEADPTVFFPIKEKISLMFL